MPPVRTHTQTLQERRLENCGWIYALGLFPCTNSSGAGQESWPPQPLPAAPSLQPEPRRDAKLPGKLPPKPLCGAWRALRSPVVYSPYKNIYVETACSSAYKANVLSPRQAPAPYSGAGSNPASRAHPKLDTNQAASPKSSRRAIYGFWSPGTGRRGQKSCADRHSRHSYTGECPEK